MKLYELIPYVAFAPFAFSAVLLPLILFGFFDDRKNGAYRFRSGRFLATIAIIFALNCLTAVPFTYIVKELVIQAVPVAEMAVEKNRIATQYTLDAVGTAFPTLINDQTRECYRAGLSNFIEDHWNRSFHDGMWQKEEVFCKTNPSICDGKQEDYYTGMREIINPRHLLFQDFSVIGYFLSSNWIAAANAYIYRRRLFHESDNKGIFQDLPDEHMLSDYGHYLSDCASFKALPWSVTGEALLNSETVFCVGNCP